MWPFNSQPAKQLPDSLCLTAPVDILALAKGDTDQSPKFRIVANTGVPMRLEGFLDPVVIDLKGAKFDRDTTPIIFNHDVNLRIGHTTKQEVKATGNPIGIFVEGVVSSGMGIAAGFVEDSKRGFPFQASTGASIVNAYFVPEGNEAKVNGQTIAGPLIVASETRIKEVSVTVLGADPATTSIAASFANKNQTFPRNDDMSETTIQAAITAERQRIGTINAMLPKPGKWQHLNERIEELRASAISGQKTVADITREVNNIRELEAHYAGMEGTPTGQSSGPYHWKTHGSAAVNGDVLQAALLCRAGYESVAEKSLGSRVMESASRYRSLSFPDFARMALEAEGRDVPHSRDAMIRASFSTNGFTNALGGAMDKLLHITFQEAGASWRSYAAKKPLSNFREHTLISPQHRGQLLELPNHGEIKHGWLDEDTSTIRLATYAKMISVSRTDIANDDLNVFDQVARVFAVQGIRKMNDLVYETIMANANNFFHADHNNLLTGADSALSATSLADAVAKMRKQRDLDDNDLDIRPAVLVVPPELEVEAREILSSVQVNKTGDNEPVGNALKDIATLEVEPRLSNTAKFENASTTAWYLFSTPSNAPVYVATLDGREAPIVEEMGFDADPKYLAYTWRCYGDWGAALGTWQAAVKSAGA